MWYVSYCGMYDNTVYKSFLFIFFTQILYNYFLLLLYHVVFYKISLQFVLCCVGFNYTMVNAGSQFGQNLPYRQTL